MSSTGKMILIGVPYDAFSNSTHTGASEATTSNPLANLGTLDPKEIWRSTSVTNQSLECRRQLSSTLHISACALINHNMGSTGTYSIDTGTSTAYSDGHQSSTKLWLNTAELVLGSTFAGGPTGIGSRDLVWLTTATIGDSVFMRLNLNDTANSDGYLQAGRWLVGEQFEISGINFKTGWTFQLEDLSQVSKTANGTLYADVRPKRRTVKVNYGAVSQDAAFNEVMHEFVNQVGVTQGFYVIFQPNTTQHWHQQAFYARLATSPTLKGIDTPISRPYWETAFTFEEII